jgi:diguanylate cyclase (GGDEF)-like protein
MRNSRSNSHQKRYPMRLSLTKLLTLALGAILVVFITFVLIAYVRLAEFRAIFSNLENKLVPTIISSGQAYKQISMLTFLTESLSKATNETERVRSYLQLKQRLENLQNEVQLNHKTSYLETQLSILNVEIDELNQLILQKITTEQAYKNHVLQLVRIYRNILSKESRHLFDQAWVLSFIKVSTSIAIINNLNTLSDIRQVTGQINDELQNLKQLNANAPSALQKQYHEELIELIAGESGILTLRVELVMIRSRALGRGNFVRNLLLDYANGADFQSYKTNRMVTQQVEQSLALINQQISKTIYIAVVLVVLLLTIIIFVHLKLTVKLQALYQHVKKSLSANQYEYAVGKDEIEEVYNIFDLFVQDAKAQHKALEEMGLTDSLTNIPNRRAFDIKLNEYLSLAKRERNPITIFMIDVDYFKAYNDNYGHLKGDECLVQVAAMLINIIKRNADFVARYGGEEFACLLLNTTIQGAKKVAQDIVNTMSEYKIAHEFSDVINHITVSIGGVTYWPDKEPFFSEDELMHTADSELYRAKESGRNCFSIVDVGSKFK